ncbi:MAG: hypothetical protein A2Y24_07985 [Clostridiales bacterium GWE2_32_10]|nr:MAG: hypothetical protein A2Y24_07985 [Clostridiales bacterium GWE2_32_10]HBY20532.1 AAA family ATPase [Clostridiales bacterium]
MKKFNITTTCIKEEHYMVDTSKKLAKIEQMIAGGMYFTINRARQYGKTTTMANLFMTLQDKYMIIAGSLEDFGEDVYKTEQKFSLALLHMIAKRMHSQDNELSDFIESFKDIQNLNELSDVITKICMKSKKEIVLMIDEVDKASNNVLFLDFLAILRDKYNSRKIGLDKTFKSVILAGVHDVKTLKMHIKERRILTEEEAKLMDKGTYNSPWNVAEDFIVDMSFNPEEIATMLVEYENDYNIGMNIVEMSEEIYYYTSGYPFLVSKICKLIDERLDKKWDKEGIKEAIKIILEESNTLFESLIKNLENDSELYSIIERIIINGENIDYNIDEYHTNKATMYGIIKRSESKKIEVHNRIFEIRIYNYMIAKRIISSKVSLNYETRNQFVKPDGNLDMEQVLYKFQELMKEEYRQETEKFVEKEGRMLFLMFVKPIINGVGFYDVEVETRTNKRIDIIVTYNRERFIIELKKWYGKAREDKGHKQLAEYLEIKNTDIGYMVMFNFRKRKKYTREWHEVEGKRIFEIVV